MLPTFLAQLGKLRGQHPRWTACCPAHEDKKPSLSIAATDDRWLVHCHAGCTTEAICKALHVQQSDLFYEKNTSEPINLTNWDKQVRYVYTDVDGTPVVRVTRRPGKDFCQEGWHGPDRGWLPGLAGCQKPLYRLPAVFKSPRVVVVEGEKDADRLAGLGICATTTGGSTSWCQHHAEHLSGKDVVVIPDADQAGEVYAQAIADSVPGLRVLRLEGLPPRGDVSDWLDAGGDVSQLLELIEKAPSWPGVPQSPYDLDGWQDNAAVLEEWAHVASLPIIETGFTELDRMLGKGLRAESVYVLAAPTKQGKTALAGQIASQVASRAPVAVWSAELKPYQLYARQVSQRTGRSWSDVFDGGPRPEYLDLIPPTAYYKGHDIDMFTEGVRRLQNERNAMSLVIVDYLQKLPDAAADDARVAVSEWSEKLRMLAQTLSCPLLVISSVSRAGAHRVRNARDHDPGDLADVAKESGSIEYDCSALITLNLEPEEEQDDAAVPATLTVATSRFSRPGQIALMFDGASGLFTELNKLEPKSVRKKNERLADIRSAILDYLSDGEVKSIRNIRKNVSGRNETIQEVLIQMVGSGEICRDNHGYQLL